MRAALYVRVLTRDKGQDVTNQLDKLREFCRASEWRIVREYQDHESAGKSDRREFQAMMSAATMRDFDVVVFWALDRFSSEGAWETHQQLQLLNESGVRFRSFTEPYLDSCGGLRDTVVSIVAAIARQERVRLSERVRAGLDRVAVDGTKSGKPVGRPRVIFARDLVIALRKEGLSWSEIAAKAGASVGSVRRAYSQMQDAGASREQDPPLEAA